jgi:hypothetical protein
MMQPAAAASGHSVSVKSLGAMGDGKTDDTVAIQKALDNYDKVYFPSGKYLIDADISLFPKSHQTITLADSAELSVIPTASENYSIFRIKYVHDVTISGGRLTGDRFTHKGKTGEWGMGINIGFGAYDVIVSNMTLRDFWGDGLIIGNGDDQAHDILIENVVCDNNRRQGLTITHAYNVTVNNSVFMNSKGTAPQCGITLEPNPGNYISNVSFNNVQCYGNAGRGLYLDGYQTIVKDIEITDCSFIGNGLTGLRFLGADNVKVKNAVMSGNNYGITIVQNTTNIEFSNIEVYDNKFSGVYIDGWSQEYGTGNIFFEETRVYNNSQSEPNENDGVTIYGSKGYLKNVIFVQCHFYDDQSEKTQRYGLSVSLKDKHGVVTVSECTFGDNISGGYKGCNALTIKS